MARRDLRNDKIRTTLVKFEQLLKQEEGVEPIPFHLKKTNNAFDREELLSHAAWWLQEARKMLDGKQPKRASVCIGFALSSLSTCEVITNKEAYDFAIA